MIGRTLDRYEIEAKLGEGGMGVVYRARDVRLERTVAIKVLPPEKLSDAERKRRFGQEAKAASALNHPGIVTVHDVGSADGVDFIVMEYVEGSTLDRLIPPKGLRQGDALRYGVQIADALARAHGAGIVHRDLKPSNVMVTHDGRVKILDFGLAKLLDATDGSPEAPTRTSPRTDAGLVLGTAAYMSPEQAEGRPLDARSDIFSFGSVMYEMVTGRRPFVGESYVSTLAKIVSQDPAAPGTLADGVPADLERLILRCLRKDPARRYQTMADLKVALEDVAADLTSGVQPIAPVTGTGRARQSSVAIWTTGAFAIFAVAVAAYFAMRGRRDLDAGPPLRALPLTSQPGTKRSPSFSPDGNQVAYSWTGPSQDNTDVYVQQIGAGTPLQVTTDPAPDISPIWSPDGRWIAFLRATSDPNHFEVRLVPPLRGAERKIADLNPNRLPLRALTLAWCPDSSCLLVTDSLGPGKTDALFAVSLESSDKKQLTNPGPLFADRDPAVSSDGKWLVFRRDQNPFTGELYRVPFGPNLTPTTEPIRLLPTGQHSYPKWTPDGATILLSGRGGLFKLTLTDGALERLPFVGEDGSMAVVSPAQSGRPSRLVYVRSFADSNIWRIDVTKPGQAAGSPPVLAIGSTRRDYLPQLSVDGKHVAFFSDRSGENELWVSDLAGNDAVALTSQRAQPGFPRWSPDGRLIAYHSDAEENAGDVFVVPSAGGKPRNLTARPGPDTFPSFSHDGLWTYFDSDRSGKFAIWKVPTAGGAAVQVTSQFAFLALESVDGQDMFYVDTPALTTAGRMMRVSVNGGTPVELFGNAEPMCFDVIDKGIYYIEKSGTEARLRFYDFATRTSALVARNLGNVNNVFSGLTASRDGRIIMFARIDSSIDDLMLVENFRQ